MPLEGFLLNLSVAQLVGIAIVAMLALSFKKAPMWLWAVLAAVYLYGVAAGQTAWIVFAVIAVVLLLPFVRRLVFTGPTFMLLKKLNILPAISDTERVAIEAGDVWIDGELFSGNPNFKRCFTQAEAKLTDEEQAFINGPVETVCSMINDFEVFQKRDLPQEVWDYLKKEKFMGMIIPREYGGLGFSAYAHSEIIAKLSARSTALGITVMVPNSLGPGELLSHYGTDEQKNHYLPRLAVGEDLPAFALTEPGAGSDASAIASHGEIFKDEQGELMLKLNWEKRYITLAAISTVLGLAFKLHDPENLLGKGTELGITCALIPTNTPGVTLGRRHDPLGVPFYNCPTVGKDVIVPVSAIIGGANGAGNGWRMLMESLAAGRGISLPATSTGGAKLVARVTGAYSAIRSQFGMTIGKFEGVAEPLAEIGGLAYMLEGARKYICGGLDNGAKPPVITAMAKYIFTESFRKSINHGMDILGGAAISRGERNLLAHPYVGVPISITVEGANILTRTLMVFGQGAIRCHPFARQEIEAIANNDIKAFDKAFVGHLGHIGTNKVRAFLLSITRGRLTSGYGQHKSVRNYTRKLAWVSACFAFWADMAMGTLGGTLKRREMLTGRFADILAWQFMILATLKRFEAEGHKQEDVAILEWSMKYAFNQIQEAFDDMFDNLAWWTKPVGIWSRLNRLTSKPSDELTMSTALLLQKPGQQRERITSGLFISKDSNDALRRYEDTLVALNDAKAVYKKLRLGRRHKKLPKGYTDDILSLAVEKNVLTGPEADTIKKAEAMRRDAVAVDSFTLETYKSFGLESA